jgi:7-cyano-7-deazaguanine synthase
MNERIVISLSGGMDSATLLAYYHDRGFKINTVFFDYGSKHNKYEKESAWKLANFYKVPIEPIDLSFIGNLFKSNLLEKGGEIPEGHYNDSSMSLTVVPGRNIIFLSILTGYAWSIGTDRIGIGVHSGDHAIYPDCRPHFIHSMWDAICYGTEDAVQLEAPFLDMDKYQILKTGVALKVPYELTRTCYKDQVLSCGKCGSCTERLEAFSRQGMKDPVPYE